MSHIDTLKVYNQYLAMGKTPEEASKYTNILEESYRSIRFDIYEYMKELKQDFASQKLIGILGSIIFAGMIAIAGTMWNISLNMGTLIKDMERIETRLTNLENRIK